MSVEELQDTTTTAGLAMEFVAMRDIHPGEELFLDYGQEWEDAWHRHVEDWEPVKDSDSYRGAAFFNSNKHVVLPTVFEEMMEPLPVNVELLCEKAFLNQTWVDHYPDNLRQFVQGRGKGEKELVSCDILRRRVDKNGRVWYTAMLRATPGMLEDVPREAFRFLDKPYTSSIHLPKAFRHAIMIPDDIFPEIWRNKKE